MNFFYSFTQTMLHSLWQSALLLLLGLFFSLTFKRLHPLYKRNLFYSILAMQLVVSIATFLFCFTDDGITVWFMLKNISTINMQQLQWLQSNSTLIFGIYATILLIKLFAMWQQWYRFKQFYNIALIKPSATLKVYTQLKAMHLGIKKNISIWYSKNVDIPVTFGFFKPVILLPFSLVNNITSAEAESIILHELAHIKNNDYFLNWLMMVVESLYFFNPFIKIVAHIIKTEREKNCDVQVINFGYNPLVYAQVLVKIAKYNNYSPAFQLAAAKKHSQLLGRIKFFTDDNKLNFKRVSPAFLLCMFLIMVSICLLPLSKNKLEERSKSVAANLNAVSTFAQMEIKIYKATEQVSSENKKIIHTEALALKDPIKEPATKKDEVENIVEEITGSTENIFSTVAYTQTADSIKEVTINLETQQGNITQVYKLLLVNGKWIVQPQWMLVEKNADSNAVKRLHSLYGRMDSIQ